MSHKNRGMGLCFSKWSLQTSCIDFSRKFVRSGVLVPAQAFWFKIYIFNKISRWFRCLLQLGNHGHIGSLSLLHESAVNIHPQSPAELWERKQMKEVGPGQPWSVDAAWTWSEKEFSSYRLAARSNDQAAYHSLSGRETFLKYICSCTLISAQRITIFLLKTSDQRKMALIVHYITRMSPAG